MGNPALTQLDSIDESMDMSKSTRKAATDNLRHIRPFGLGITRNRARNTRALEVAMNATNTLRRSERGAGEKGVTLILTAGMFLVSKNLVHYRAG